MYTSPLLSIVTITYRDPQGLRKTFESLEPLKNLGFPWEHIVVDASAELNESVIKSRIQKTDALSSFLHFVLEPIGIYGSMNYGAQKASGRYLWFLNSGDTLKSSSILRQFIESFEDSEKNSAPPLDLICGAADLLKNEKFMYQRIPHKVFIKNLLGGNHICHQAVLYRRSTFIELGLFDSRLKVAGDYEHFFRYWKTKKQVLCSPESWISFDMGGASNQWRIAFFDYFSLEDSLQKILPRSLFLKHFLLIRWELFRLFIFKEILPKFPGYDHLRSLWLSLNRMRNRYQNRHKNDFISP